MKRLMICIALLSGVWALEAQAAAQVNTAPYSTGKLCWTWQKGAPPNDAPADHLNIKCGTASGQRDLPVKAVAVPTPAANPPEYCIFIRDAIPQPPSFPANRVCAATAAFGSQESKESVEFPFSVTGSEIAAPTSPRIVP